MIAPTPLRRLLALRRPAALATAWLLFCGAAPAHAMPRNVKLGDAIAPFTLNDIDGNAVNTARWGGAPRVWVFVSAEQVSSEKALQDVQAALDSLVGADVHAVALTADGLRIPYFRQLRSRFRLHLPIVLDAGREVYGRIGVIVLPTTLLIDREGRLAHVLSGYDPRYAHEVQSRLAFLAGRISADELTRRLSTTRPTRDPVRERAERHVRAAEILLGRGLRADAARELERAIEVDATCSSAYLHLARVRAAEGDVPGAEKLVEQVRSRQPDNRDARLVLGMIRFRQDRLDEAESLLKEALVLNPDPARTHYWLGRTYLAKHDAPKAAEHLRIAAELAMPDLDDSRAVRPRD